MKGEKIACQDLRQYLYSIDNYRQASMLRKGREVHKIYCEVHKGPSFLDDRFTLTEFGKMVLQNGSVRAGRAKNVRHIVMARETLYCSGTNSCKRGCGGFGVCVPGCEKHKVRGHKCSFRVKLTMRLGFADFWFVEVLGNHSNFTDEPDPTATDVKRMVSEYEGYTQTVVPVITSNHASEEKKLVSSVGKRGAISIPEVYCNSPSLTVTSHHLNIPVFPETYSLNSVNHVQSPAQSTPTSQDGNTQLSPLTMAIKQEPVDDAYLGGVMLAYANGHGAIQLRQLNEINHVENNNDIASVTDDSIVETQTYEDSRTNDDIEEEYVDMITEESDNEEKDLLTRVRQLEAHVTQLRNIVLKGELKVDCKKKLKAQREFDFSKYNTRHIALKIAYLGWDHQGFVVQEETDKTIEAAVFDALLKTRLIESREVSNYHRCGRTDKGVSALSQVISIDLRTNLLDGPGVKQRDGGSAHLRQGDKSTEIRYVHILNKVLPPEIRVLAWAPVEHNFSARFSCKRRTYKYYFPKGNLDLGAMCEASAKLIGEHDFRNLCKMDVGNGVVNFTRRILSAEIKILDERENGYQMCELTIVGQAFLWHQVRCIVAVLMLVGQGKEGPDIIDELLNIEQNPRKPQYTMASEIPLVLFDCDFGDDVEWVYEADWHEDNIRHLQQLWAQHAVKAAMIKGMLDQLDTAKVETESDIAPWNELSAPILQQSEWLTPGNKPRIYRPLLERPMCDSLEDRIEHFAKRRKTGHHTEQSEGNGNGHS
ncbi:tRNA pseudouridine(38/39) synthase-like [Haliotis cracherodii]|uniref:tRNA pseudouridine(38/39) synthase-like n=1 Tax=Haliotis cracherodii TaxID=6455 RepID=UPI001EB056E0|nr:tRNA pseudouridine(38/39) synthase-like isoform X1 [Haliotis rufescens]XP_046362073.1 tRNA pseudouridine(38/39) synthase-like isoform X1 [Haliotis rufescens]